MSKRARAVLARAISPYRHLPNVALEPIRFQDADDVIIFLNAHGILLSEVEMLGGNRTEADAARLVSEERLRDAAPDLLAVALLLIDNPDVPIEIEAAARDAIAKAKGEVG